VSDPPKKPPQILVALNGGSLAVWRLISLMQSPAYRVLTKTGHLALSRIEIEWANGRHHVSHAMFRKYGLPRDGISHALAEIEGLGLVAIQRHAAKSNSFGKCDKWRSITSLAEAHRVRDRVRDFGRRRKHERATARIKRQNHQCREA
jgi:hypothetical protein